MNLDEFGKSVSEMTTEELIEHLRLVRKSRRETTGATSKARTKSAKAVAKAGGSGSKQEREAQAILAQLSDEQLKLFRAKVKGNVDGKV